MVKQTVVHPYHGVLLRNIKEQTSYMQQWMDLKGIILSEKANLQKLHMVYLYNILEMIKLQKENRFVVCR